MVKIDRLFYLLGRNVPTHIRSSPRGGQERAYLVLDVTSADAVPTLHVRPHGRDFDGLESDVIAAGCVQVFAERALPVLLAVAIQVQLPPLKRIR